MSSKKIVVQPTPSVEGYFNEVAYPHMTLFKFLIFRLLLLPAFLSPLYSKIIRKLLQKILILNKKKISIQFQRKFKLDDGLKITDMLKIQGSSHFTQLAIGTDHTSIYTAISNGYQESALQSWVDLNSFLKTLNEKKEIILDRHIQ